MQIQTNFYERKEGDQKMLLLHNHKLGRTGDPLHLYL